MGVTTKGGSKKSPGSSTENYIAIALKDIINLSFLIIDRIKR